VIPAAFSVAPAGERTLDAGAYLGGVLELAIVVAALAYGAYSVRALLLGDWRGAPARLAELVLATSALIVVSELLGVVGLFTEAAVIAWLVAVGIGAGLASRAIAVRRPFAPASAPPAPPAAPVAKACAVAVVAALAAAWAVPTLGTLAAGMDRADSLWYHMPLAARFVQTGHLGPIFFFDPIYFASFYPANSEIVHALGILLTGRDIISPLVNDGWLAVSLLAAWCIGRPYGLGPQAMIGASVGLGAQMLVEFQAGEALNDITGVAFTLAAVAILVNAYAVRRPGGGARGSPPAPIAVAALATGVAAGVKLSFLVPAAVLTVGVIVIARAGQRRRTAVAWIVPMAATGVFWYARNLVAVGNPVPYIHHLGPISLPGPVRDFSLRPSYAVAHYWNDTSVWTHWFFPGLHSSFGLLWPVTIVGLAAIAIYAAFRAAEPIMRVLGVFVALTAIAYLFTPLTAAGVQGQPIAFTWNLRYLAPAVTVAFAILPCLPALRATPTRRLVVLAVLFVLVGFTIGSLVEWHQGHTKGALAAGAVVVIGAAVLALLARRGIRPSTVGGGARAAVAAGVLAVVIAVGYGYQVHYLDHRYEDTGDAQDLNRALAWARDVRGARIALAGIRAVFTQYPFYGEDLSNRVQWLGRRVDDDGYARIATCTAWRKAVNDGHFRFVVTTFDPYLPAGLTNTPEGRWTGSDPHAHVVLRQGPVSVFRIGGRLNPAGCAGQAPLTRRQLHGVPDPTLKAR
jgi:hypothetical protein